MKIKYRRGFFPKLTLSCVLLGVLAVVSMLIIAVPAITIMALATVGVPIKLTLSSWCAVFWLMFLLSSVGSSGVGNSFGKFEVSQCHCDDEDSSE